MIERQVATFATGDDLAARLDSCLLQARLSGESVSVSSDTDSGIVAVDGPTRVGSTSSSTQSTDTEPKVVPTLPPSILVKNKQHSASDTQVRGRLAGELQKHGAAFNRVRFVDELNLPEYLVRRSCRKPISPTALQHLTGLGTVVQRSSAKVAQDTCSVVRAEPLASASAQPMQATGQSAAQSSYCCAGNETCNQLSAAVHLAPNASPIKRPLNAKQHHLQQHQQLLQPAHLAGIGPAALVRSTAHVQQHHSQLQDRTLNTKQCACALCTHSVPITSLPLPLDPQAVQKVAFAATQPAYQAQAALRPHQSLQHAHACLQRLPCLPTALLQQQQQQSMAVNNGNGTNFTSPVQHYVWRNHLRPSANLQLQPGRAASTALYMRDHAPRPTHQGLAPQSTPALMSSYNRSQSCWTLNSANFTNSNGGGVMGGHVQQGAAAGFCRNYTRSAGTSDPIAAGRQVPYSARALDKQFSGSCGNISVKQVSFDQDPLESTDSMVCAFASVAVVTEELKRKCAAVQAANAALNQQEQQQRYEQHQQYQCQSTERGMINGSASLLRRRSTCLSRSDQMMFGRISTHASPACATSQTSGSGYRCIQDNSTNPDHGDHLYETIFPSASGPVSIMQISTANCGAPMNEPRPASRQADKPSDEGLLIDLSFTDEPAVNAASDSDSQSNPQQTCGGIESKELLAIVRAGVQLGCTAPVPEPQPSEQLRDCTQQVREGAGVREPPVTQDSGHANTAVRKTQQQQQVRAEAKVQKSDKLAAARKERRKSLSDARVANAVATAAAACSNTRVHGPLPPTTGGANTIKNNRTKKERQHATTAASKSASAAAVVGGAEQLLLLPDSVYPSAASDTNETEMRSSKKDKQQVKQLQKSSSTSTTSSQQHETKPKVTFSKQTAATTTAKSSWPWSKEATEPTPPTLAAVEVTTAGKSKPIGGVRRIFLKLSLSKSKSQASKDKQKVNS